MLTKKVPKSSADFFCKNCNYTTSRKSQYDRHLMTAKHKMLTNVDKKVPKSSAPFQCDCGKQFKYRQSLSRHRQKCGIEQSNEKNIFKDDYTDENIMMELIKQNEEFKSLLIEQQQENMKQQKENLTLQSQLVEAVKVGKIENNYSNNTINNNQKFNLNFFLNTTCKDAMNMSEFIENICVDLEDIENIGKNGYVQGMTNMILLRIKDLDVTKRPLHCTDLKRETMYIKNNDVWSKDTPNNNELRNLITIVSNNNNDKLPLWREKYPECQNVDNAKYEFCIDMMRNVLGDVGDEQRKLENKIIKNISKHILVDKC